MALCWHYVSLRVSGRPISFYPGMGLARFQKIYVDIKRLNCFCTPYVTHNLNVTIKQYICFLYAESVRLTIKVTIYFSMPMFFVRKIEKYLWIYSWKNVPAYKYIVFAWISVAGLTSTVIAFCQRIFQL